MRSLLDLTRRLKLRHAVFLLLLFSGAIPLAISNGLLIRQNRDLLETPPGGAQLSPQGRTAPTRSAARSTPSSERRSGSSPASRSAARGSRNSAVPTWTAEAPASKNSTTSSTEVAGGANSGSTSTMRVLHTAVLNDTANWCLGRSQAVEVSASHSLPGGESRTRDADQSWDPVLCRPTRIRLMPGIAASRVTHDLSYDGFGNLIQLHQD